VRSFCCFFHFFPSSTFTAMAVLIFTTWEYDTATNTNLQTQSITEASSGQVQQLEAGPRQKRGPT
jgi:hypothetical protein